MCKTDADNAFQQSGHLLIEECGLKAAGDIVRFRNKMELAFSDPFSSPFLLCRSLNLIVPSTDPTHAYTADTQIFGSCRPHARSANSPITSPSASTMQLSMNHIVYSALAILHNCEWLNVRYQPCYDYDYCWTDLYGSHHPVYKTTFHPTWLVVLVTHFRFHQHVIMASILILTSVWTLMVVRSCFAVLKQVKS